MIRIRKKRRVWKRYRTRKKGGQNYWVNLNIPQYAKSSARRGLALRKKLPPSKRFGITPKEAKKLGIDSGIIRAQRIIRNEAMPEWETRKVARFYKRFKNKTGDRAEGAHLLWGGRKFGRKAVAHVKKYNKRNYGFGIKAKKIGTNLNYGEGNLQIEADTGEWKQLGPAKKTFSDISDQTGVEIRPIDLMLNPTGVRDVIKEVYPNTKNWKIIPKEEPIIELEEADD